jgi:hypothetical protein
MKFCEPGNGRLAAIYAEARRLTDGLGIHKWHHHLRAFNKMADSAAKVAMDSRASSQVLHPTTRLQHAELARHLGFDDDDDVVYWLLYYVLNTDSASTLNIGKPIALLDLQMKLAQE